MKVAVIMPVYNSEQYLTEAIDSILKQTYRNFVLIAVDDGSTDGSPQLLQSAAGIDRRIVVLSKRNEGASAARNAALEYIETARDFDLVCFFDSDDVVRPDFLETYVQLMNMYDADYVVSGFLRWFKNVEVRISRVDEGSCLLNGLESLSHFAGDSVLKRKAPEASSNLLAHRCFSSSVVHGMRFRQDLRVCEDQQFVLRALLKVKKGVISRKITYLYRQRGSSLTRDVREVDSEIRFVSWLFGVYESGDQNLRRAILLYIVRLWWLIAKKIYENNLVSEYERDVWEILRKIRKCKEIYGLPRRYLKKIFLCGLGCKFMSFYFYVFPSKKIGSDLEVFE